MKKTIAALVAVAAACGLWLRARYVAPPVDDVAATILREYVRPSEPLFERRAAPDGRTFLLMRDLDRFGPEAFAMPKPEGTARVFVLGESVGNFFRKWWWGPDRGFGEALARLYPGRRFEVINCAASGYDSAREALALREILQYQPDLIVLLAGNNEGMHLPATLPFPRPAYLARQVGGGVAASLPQPRPRMPSQDEIDAAMAREVRGMIRAAKARGAAFVLCTLPIDLTLPPASAAARARFAAARALETAGKEAESLAAYREAVDLDPVARTTPRRNDLLRQIAREEGALLADLERAFSRIDSRGGARLFYDAEHWYWEYNPLAGAVIERALCGAWRSDWACDRAEADGRLESAYGATMTPAAAEQYAGRTLRYVADCARRGDSARATAKLVSFEGLHPGTLVRLERRSGDAGAAASAALRSAECRAARCRAAAAAADAEAPWPLAASRGDAAAARASIWRDAAAWRRAEADYRADLLARPRDASLREGLGRALLAQGRLDAGLAEIEAADRLGTRTPAALLAAARALLRAGRRREGAALLARIAPDPAVIDDNPDGDALARELCSPGGRREDCAAMLGAFLAGRRSAGDAGTALLFEDYMRRTLAGLR